MGNETFGRAKPRSVEEDSPLIEVSPPALKKKRWTRARTLKGDVKRRPSLASSLFRRNPKEKETSPIASKDWLEDQRKLFTDDERSSLLQAKFEQVFKQLSSQVRIDVGSRQEKRQTVNKPVFLTTCKQLFGEEIDSYMFNKLFDFMDSDQNGVVDEVEFAITVCFLLRAQDTIDNTELAYKIFNSTRSGGLSKKEFSEMLAAIIGTSMKTVERILPIRVVFEKFVKSRLMMDALLFYRQVVTYLGNYEQVDEIPPIPIVVAEQIANTFLMSTSPCNLNISHLAREDLLQAILKAKENKDIEVKATLFLKCYNEVNYLLESNTLLGFKSFLRKPPYSDITVDVWKRFGLKNKEQLNYKQFSTWTSENPGIFAFITDMQKSMSSLVESLMKNSSFDNVNSDRLD